MKLLKKYRAYIIIFGVISVIFLLYAIFGSNTQAMNFIVNNITRPYRSFMGGILAFFPFSVAELFWIATIVVVLVYTGITIYKMCKLPNALQRGIKYLLNLVSGVLIIYAAFTIFWGIDYKTNSFSQKIQFDTTGISTDALRKTSALFLEKVNRSADKVKRDDSGVFAEKKSDIFSQSDELYAKIEKEYPFLQIKSYRAKPMLFSPILSLADFTGFYFPLTGESTINVDQPAAYIANTIAHELAHQRGVVEEDAANFLAIRVCDESDSAIYNYSGSLLAYIYLSNALYTADKDAWQAQSEVLSPFVKKDLAANNEYWKKFETPVATISNTVYDGFLQNYGDEDGLKSYGAVVDWLVSYYSNLTYDSSF